MEAAACVARVAMSGVAILFVLSPGSVQAQKLELTFNEGRVSVVAQNVAVYQILDEWARVGGTKVVHANLLGGERVSLQLDRVPEATAIKRILESAAGYVARRRRGATGASDFELIVVLATSDAPADAAAEKNTDSTSQARWHVEPPPLASPPDLTSDEAPADPDVDPDSTSSSNEANGRAPGTRPFEGRLAPEVVALPADQLPAGR